MKRKLYSLALLDYVAFKDFYTIEDLNNYKMSLINESLNKKDVFYLDFAINNENNKYMLYYKVYKRFDKANTLSNIDDMTIYNENIKEYVDRLVIVYRNNKVYKTLPVLKSSDQNYINVQYLENIFTVCCHDESFIKKLNHDAYINNLNNRYVLDNLEYLLDSFYSNYASLTSYGEVCARNLFNALVHKDNGEVNYKVLRYLIDLVKYHEYIVFKNKNKNLHNEIENKVNEQECAQLKLY